MKKIAIVLLMTAVGALVDTMSGTDYKNTMLMFFVGSLLVVYADPQTVPETSK